jgi:hypothetical protein
MPNTPSWTDVATWIASLAAAVSAFVAAVQLRRSRLDSNYRLTVDLLRDLAERLEAVQVLDIPAVRTEITQAYSGNATLSDHGRTFMAFLHAIELLADARQHGGVDKPMVDRFLGSLVRADVFPLSFLNGLQVALKDNEAYTNTRALLIQYKETAQR